MVVGKTRTTSPSKPSEKFPVTYADDEESGAIYAILCGYSGTGKTHIMGTFPGLFVLNTDRGTKTIADKHVPKIDLLDFKNIYIRVLDVIRAIADKVPPFDKLKVKTIGLDDLTRFCMLMETDVLNDPPDGKDRAEALFQSDYGLIQKRVGKVLTMAKAIKGVNFVACCGIKSSFDETSKESVDVPAVTGQAFGPTLGHYFDYVVQTRRTKDGEFWADIAPTRRFKIAKIRKPGGLPDGYPRKLPNLTFDVLSQIDKGTFKYKPEKTPTKGEEEEE